VAVKDDEKDQSVRVMTMNLLSPTHADWPRRREVLQRGIADLAPDVIALQETVWGDGWDQAVELLGPEYRIARHAGRSDDGVGAVLASRWPLGTIRELDLRVTPRVRMPWSAAVAAEVRLPGGYGTTLFVHHKPIWAVGYARERELAAVATARLVEDLVGDRTAHVVVLGDFDDTPDSSSLRFWTGRQSLDGFSVAYRDAWEAVHPEARGHTFTPDNPLVTAGEMSLEFGRRIDYILVRCGVHGPTLRVADCFRAFDRPVGGVWASDHFGVVADLALPAHPPGGWVD
jgi:endonuclease/exonuclease/phosphatase family metal-dependent hydrolase